MAARATKRCYRRCASCLREGVDDEVELRPVESLEAAERARFLGSPTVRVDGKDIDPGAGDRSDYGLKCRLYRSGEETSGLPPEEWIVEAIRSRAGVGDE